MGVQWSPYLEDKAVREKVVFASPIANSDVIRRRTTMPDMKLSRRGLVQLGLGAATAGLGHRQRGSLAYAAPIPTTSITNAFLF